jgi:hypothetical protein
VGKQVLSEQDPFDFVLVFANDREPRVAGFDNAGQEIVDVGVNIDNHHLGARNHRVANLGFGYFQGPFHHRQRIGIDDAVCGSSSERSLELFTVPGLRGERFADLFDKGLPHGTVTRLVVAHVGSGDGAERASLNIGVRSI